MLCNAIIQVQTSKLLTKKKVVFGSKLRPKKSVNRSCVRDKDIAHFTAFVLQKNTRVRVYIYVLKYHNSHHRHGLGDKVHPVHKVKVGNVVLEATKSGIIRDYIKTTQLANQTCGQDERIQVFRKRTYLRWLQV